LRPETGRIKGATSAERGPERVKCESKAGQTGEVNGEEEDGHEVLDLDDDVQRDLARDRKGCEEAAKDRMDADDVGHKGRSKDEEEGDGPGGGGGGKGSSACCNAPW
jgi:hypothetical protein